MVGSHVIGEHVLHQRSSTATVKEVPSNAHVAPIVGRGKTAIEVGNQVDLGIVELLLTAVLTSRVRRVLIGSVVLPQQGRIVTDGFVGWTLSSGSAGSGHREKGSVEAHRSYNNRESS